MIPRTRVLTLSTIAFTVLFAVWLMFGLLGVTIKGEAELMLGADAIASMTSDEIKAACESRFEWLLAVSILTGSLFRLNFGIWADQFGGKVMMIGLLLFCAIPTYFLAHVQTFPQLLLCGALIGLAGNSFSVGISWNSAWSPQESKGFALGVFGAGNVGASGTKLLLIAIPTLLTLVPAAGFLGGWIPGGWRIVPVFYSLLLLLTAVAVYLFTPSPDLKPGQGRPIREMIKPLQFVRVWRFSLYYVVVFGAYVALAGWLPSYYVSTYQLPLRDAAILTSIFIFPASLLRPLGGWLSDQFGPRIVTVCVFIGMTIATIPLCLPRSVLALDVMTFTILLALVGVGMGIGKASVYKFIPNYFPADVGAVGGMVGLFGALGGFVLPKAFGWFGRATGVPQAAFLVLLGITAVSMVWHFTVIYQLNAAAKPATDEPLSDGLAVSITGRA